MPARVERDSRPRAACARDASPRTGFTLIELLIVISLIAIVLGLGLGVFARLDLADRTAVSLVQNLLRSAHNWSVAREAPARVVLDEKSRSLRAEGMQVVGTWHFEGNVEGAFGLDGAQMGGRFVDDGFQGQALSFAGEGARARVEIPVQLDPSFDLGRGFTIQCALRMQPGQGGSLLALGESAGIETSEDGRVKGWISAETQDEKTGEPQKGGRIPLESPALALTPGRWTELEFQYDRRALRLYADRVLVAEVDEDAPVWKLDARTPLVLSPGNQAWPGAIDNLVISAVGSEESVRLPRNVNFGKNAPKEILFAAGGALDRDAHREPVKITLEFEDGRTAPVVVNLYGTVE